MAKFAHLNGEQVLGWYAVEVHGDNIPTPNVTENPFIGPLPIKKSIIAAIKVVTFASIMVVLDFV